MHLRHVLPAIAIALAPAAGYAENYVIHISVDGLGPSYLQPRIDANLLPNFKRLQTQGAWTNNARTDVTHTITLPNHTSQATGRPVLNVAAIQGHNWTTNVDPAPTQTIHLNKGSYVASIFDVAHDNAMRTAMYSSKTKFSIFDTSYNATNGADDLTGANNGKDKIDVYNTSASAATVTTAFVAGGANPARFSFLHYADTDNAGHDFGWGSAQYNAALLAVDSALGQLFSFIDANSTFAGKTYIVLTSDHGGSGTGHSDANNALHYTIPFYVWGPTVRANSNLYTLNPGVRFDPSTLQVAYTAANQPFRNGDAANLELDLLGLGPVSGSTMNFAQAIAVPEPASLSILAIATPVLLRRRKVAR
jgi:hypothetical protein